MLLSNGRVWHSRSSHITANPWPPCPANQRLPATTSRQAFRASRALDSVPPNPHKDRRLAAPRTGKHAMSALPSVPVLHGRFGPYGGRFVPETLMYALRQLTEEYDHARQDSEFQRQLHYYLTQYVGRPSPLYFA